jgi:hypothetical protein
VEPVLDLLKFDDGRTYHKPEGFGLERLNPVLYDEKGVLVPEVEYSNFIWKEGNDGFYIDVKISRTVLNGDIHISQKPDENFPHASIFVPIGAGNSISIYEVFLVENVDLTEETLAMIFLKSAAPAVPNHYFSC